jgi:lipopolysaccharide export system protein LptC
MNDRSLPLLPLAVLILLAGLTFWLSQYVNNDRSRSSSKLRHDPDIIIEKFTAQKLSPSGNVEYVITADKMTHFPDDDSAAFDRIVLTAEAPGQPKTVMRAPRARSQQGGDVIIMDGGVVINAAATGRSPAMTFTTPKLTVLPDKNIARSTDGVTIDSSQGTMKAAIFELNNTVRELRTERFKAVLRSGQ